MTALLDVSDISIRFGGIVAADGVNLCVNAGENLAIIGPNGAGKTTFLNICTGYLTPVSGTVRFEGCNITRMPPRKITNLASRAFQIPVVSRTDRAKHAAGHRARNGGWFTRGRLAVPPQLARPVQTPQSRRIFRSRGE